MCVTRRAATWRGLFIVHLRIPPFHPRYLRWTDFAEIVGEENGRGYVVVAYPAQQLQRGRVRWWVRWR